MPRRTATSPRRKRNRPQQLGLALRTWGGARRGAGRRPKGETAGVSHRTRPALGSRFPVHVTLRMQPEVWSLRSRRSFRVLERAFFAGSDRFGFRLCEFSIQGNHMHLLVEASDRRALSRGLQGLGIRIAKGLNRMMGRKGRVFTDRYHAHILRTPTEARHAMNYLRDNHRRHRAQQGTKLSAQYVDTYSSASAQGSITLPEPQTWMLKVGWQRAKPSGGSS
jgi:REP element-mobilizing transposase RayT